MSTRRAPPPDHDATTLALALFERLEEEGKHAHPSLSDIDRALVAVGIRPTSPSPRHPASAPRERADRYRGSRALGSGGIQEIGDDAALAVEHTAETLGVALVTRLLADGHGEAATAVAASLRALGIDTHKASIGPVDPDPHKASFGPVDPDPHRS